MAKLTPVMRQYADAKALHPDAILFFRLGDFYEMFFDDAVVASSVLGITLTSRNKESPTSEPMAGVPHHSAHGYIARLLAAGHKVAICEQLADPSKVKGIVPRAVVRVVTPGLVTDDDQLEARENHFLCALEHLEGHGYGVALLDLSTGELSAATLPDAAQAVGEVSRASAREVLLGLGAADLEPTLREIVPRAVLRAPSAAPAVEATLDAVLGVEGGADARSHARAGGPRRRRARPRVRCRLFAAGPASRAACRPARRGARDARRRDDAGPPRAGPRGRWRARGDAARHDRSDHHRRGGARAQEARAGAADRRRRDPRAPRSGGAAGDPRARPLRAALLPPGDARSRAAGGQGRARPSDPPRPRAAPRWARQDPGRAGRDREPPVERTRAGWPRALRRPLPGPARLGPRRPARRRARRAPPHARARGELHQGRLRRGARRRSSHEQRRRGVDRRARGEAARGHGRPGPARPLQQRLRLVHRGHAQPPVEGAAHVPPQADGGHGRALQHRRPRPARRRHRVGRRASARA